MWLGMCWRAPKHPSNTAECQQAIDWVSYLSDCGGANLGKRIKPLDCAGSRLGGVAIGMLVLAGPTRGVGHLARGEAAGACSRGGCCAIAAGRDRQGVDRPRQGRAVVSVRPHRSGKVRVLTLVDCNGILGAAAVEIRPEASTRDAEPRKAVSSPGNLKSEGSVGRVRLSGQVSRQQNPAQRKELNAC